MRPKVPYSERKSLRDWNWWIAPVVIIPSCIRLWRSAGPLWVLGTLLIFTSAVYWFWSRGYYRSKARRRGDSN